MDELRRIEINTPALTRVEGEGKLELAIAGTKIEHLRLRIFEPPRYFEKFLEGREYTEVPDITARICGICPVAYQMSAVEALEWIHGVSPTPWIHRMRRVLYCGEWIQSHALHIHLLALPDFLGFGNALEMGKAHPDVLRRGLRLQGLGNELVRLLGARSVHPVGTRVGGFFHAPAPADASALADRLEAALPDAEALIGWLADIEVPDVTQDFVSVALANGDAYPMIGRRIQASDGLDIPVDEYEQHFREDHVPHSTALHACYHDRPFVVGPIARLNLHLERLPARSRELLDRTGIEFPSQNMYHSMLARAVELHLAIDEAAKLLRAYRMTDTPWVEHTPKAGTGSGASEAPRGLLWHSYETDENGLIRAARIIPPTSQNQARIEEDIGQTLQHLGLDRPAEELRFEAERVIRNYDPCISCATHFLRLEIEHR